MITDSILKRLRNASTRNRQLAYYALSSYIARGGAFLASLISIPLTYNYLGAYEFGLLSTIVSIVSLLGFADLGVGFGLQNLLPTVSNSKDGKERSVYIATSFIIQVIISLFVLVLGLIFAYLTNVITLLNTEGIEGNLVKSSFACFLFFFCLSIPFSIVQRIQTANQEGHLSQIWVIIGNVISIVTLFLFVETRASLPWIIVALYGIPSLTLVANYLYEFWIRNAEYRPRLRLGSISVFKPLLNIGTAFLIVQVASMFLNASSNMIVAEKMGLKNVADFSVIIRFVTLMAAPVAMVFPTILPAVNDALVQKDHLWIKRLMRRSTLLLTIYALMSSILIWLCGEWIFTNWMGNHFILPPDFILPTICYSIYWQINALISYIMLSSMYIKLLVRIYPFAVVVSIIMKYAGIVYNGMSGMIWGEIISMSLLFFLPSLIIITKREHL